MLQVKRIYEAPTESDGFRVLVDRLWPRGVSKEKATLDLWLKEVAPSPELRVWFNHEPEKFIEFSSRYTDELDDNPVVNQLKDLISKHPNLTLLYGAKNQEINHAVVLRKFLEK